MHSGAINQIYFPKSENYFIVASTDKSVSFWNMRDYQHICSLQYNDTCLALTLTPDEKMLIVAEKEFIYIRENPITNTQFSIYGMGQGSNEFTVIDYMYRIIHGKLTDHNPLCDRYFISPTMTNMGHLYTYFNLPDALSQGLKSGLSLINSKRMSNPLSISIDKDHIDCTNVILKHLKSKVQENPYAMLFFENNLIDLNKRGLQSLEDVYENLLLRGKDASLPKFCNETVKLPILYKAQHIDPDSNDFLSKDQRNGSGRAICFYYSAVPLAMELGSQSSIDFLSSVVECSNQEIYRTKLVGQILDQKWTKILWFVTLEAAFYMTYLLTLTIYIVNYIGEDEQLILPFICNVVLMIYELYQIFVGKFDYWFDI